jgi:FkbH-like protein
MSAMQLGGPVEPLRPINAACLLSQPIDALERLATRLRRTPLDARGAGPKLKVAVLSSFLTDYLVDMLRLMLTRWGFDADIVAAGYGQLLHEVFDAGPALASAPAIVFFLPSHRDLRHAPDAGKAGPEDAARAAAQEAAFWAGALARIPCPTVMLSFAPPSCRALAEADGLMPGGLGRHARQTSLALADLLPSSAMLVDAEALRARLGPDGDDPRLYALCKQPFGMAALPEVADTLAAAAAAVLGRARKVLVLDLDNTLWGGVVGDVGVEGLTLGPETAEGEAFTAFQLYAQALARRGVILAVCTKNNEDIARDAFRGHPAMVLREQDIAVFMANFDDKATNLRRIAQTLNVGLDALVFVDDNPVERAWVARELPEVWVIDLPEDPAFYCAAVERAKPFPVHRVTPEDLARGESYRALAAVRRQGAAATDIDGFLRDLAPVATIEAVDQGTIDRIVQLIGKTNQFKLNPTVFTHAQIRDGADGVIALRLSDRLQDYGIVAVAVTARDGDALVLRNWVMSCRIFGRRLEHVMRGALCDLAARAGAARIVTDYAPSAKNGLVPGILMALGFVARGDGRFEASPGGDDVLAHHMTIRDERQVLAEQAVA